MGKDRMMNAIKQDSIAEQVADFLRKEIVNGDLKAGEKVIEYNVCSQLNVSRTPVREAFRILQAEGYLSHRPRFGAYVTELSVQDVLDCWEVRTHLEEMVARKTAENCDGKTKALIRYELEKIQAALANESLSEAAYRNLDETYYNIHVSGCKNKKLEEVARGLRVSSSLMCGKPKYSVIRAKEALREITNIYNAYLENDPEKAVKYNRVHFEASLKDITQFL